MHNKRTTEIWVGAFVILAIIAIFVMVFKVADVKSFGGEHTYTLHANFDNIGNLKVRSPVKVGGVVVGRVSNISLDTQTNLPTVTMEINQKYDNFADTSTLKILTSGLIGEQYIGLVPGFIFDGIGKVMVNGDSVENTKSAIVLEDLIGQFLYRDGGSSNEKAH